MLQMHDEIAFLQIGEINVERGTRGQGVRGFQPARTLDFITPKNFRIGDDDEFRLFADETARQRADVDLQDSVSAAKPYSFQISSKRWRSPSLLQKT